jgi:hypothetical protein
MNKTVRFYIPFVLAGLFLYGIFSVVGTSSRVTAAQSPDIHDDASLDTSQSSAFTYQGRLSDQEGSPITGTCDFWFSLFDSLTGQTQIGPTLERSSVQLKDGYFTIGDLDFGSDAFPGDDRFLEISADCPAGQGAPETFERQAITSAPYAMHSASAASVPWSGLLDVPKGFADGEDNGLTSVSWTDILSRPPGLDDGDDNTIYFPGTGLSLNSNTFAISSTFRLPQSCGGGAVAMWSGSAWVCGEAGSGEGWSLTGNMSTTAGINYLGTNDDEPLQLHVNGIRALWLEPNTTSPNLIGGYSGNSVSTGFFGSTIGGGGRDLAINQVTNNFSTIAGGAGNTASGYATSIGGGEGNWAGGNYSNAGGGQNNAITGTYATIAGGGYNQIFTTYSTVGGGYGNVVSGTFATISGGSVNEAKGAFATAGGGAYNSALASYATIAGGGPSDLGNPTTSNNQVFDEYGTVGGGGGNVAGNAGDSDPTTQPYSTVGGGENNQAVNGYATIAGGNSNLSSGYAAFIGGGLANEATANYATVAGGTGNQATGQYSTISGGRNNSANNNYSSIGGGGYNASSAGFTTIGGGYGNVVTATYGTIPGGMDNYVSGNYSFAAGMQASAEHEGTFVWSDSTGGFASTAPNQFLIDASGGVGIGTNNPTHMLTVEGSTAIQGGSAITVSTIMAHVMLQQPSAVFATEDLIYVTGYSTNTLSTWNVADPTNYNFVGYTTFQLGGPVDIQVVGNRAYVASHERDMLTILDISDPADISHVGDTSDNLDGPVAVYVSGKYAYVASSGINGGYDGLVTFDVTDAPSELKATGFITSSLQGTSDVFVSGAYAYVTSEYNNRLVIFDVSDPRNITLAGYTSASLLAPVQVAISGMYAYVLSRDTNAVVVFDISDPSSILKVGQVETSLTRPRSIYVSGDRTYIAYEGAADTGEQCGLAVLDVSIPTNIQALNIIDMSDWLVEQIPPKPVAVTGYGEYLYLVNEKHDSVTIFEINHLETPVVKTGELQTAHLDVSDDAVIEGELSVSGGLNVGPSGALIEGALSVEGEGDSYIQGRLGIGPVGTVITVSVSLTESQEVTLYHPTHQLDVDGEARFRVNDHNNLILRSSNTGSDEDAYIDLIHFDQTTVLTPSARIEFDAADPITHTTNLKFYTQGSDDSQMHSRLEITSDGDVRPGENGIHQLGTPDHAWLVVYANDFVTVSDASMKENIATLPYGLAELAALRPVAFTWAGNPEDGQHYGLIAQEVREILPDLVYGDEDQGEMLSMNYSELVPVLVNAVQEQEQQIDQQAEQIASMEARLAALEKGQSGSDGWLQNVNYIAMIALVGFMLGGTVIFRNRQKGGGK